MKCYPYFNNDFGNPSSVYSYGRDSKKAIENARYKIAKLINADAREIFFEGEVQNLIIGQ